MMKKNIHPKTLFISGSVLFMLLIVFSGCYRYPDFDNADYDEYRRVIGPEGGTINFYGNYDNDSVKNIIVKMEFPENAVDSFIVFNMYEFYDNVMYNELYTDIYTEQFSDFLYFVPFYESEGYKPELNDSINIDSAIQRHTSINFNVPVSITYSYRFYEDIPDSAELYRIKIPAENEWDEENNVWLKYNYQGYPDGYDKIDLIYLITGRWTENTPWGTGNPSRANWEKVNNFTFDPEKQSVSFTVENTDYMYVMAVVN